jgi:hypothetical protein
MNPTSVEGITTKVIRILELISSMHGYNLDSKLESSNKLSCALSR